VIDGEVNRTNTTKEQNKPRNKTNQETKPNNTERENENRITQAENVRSAGDLQSSTAGKRV
jgi:hypothetical protein